MCDLGNLTLSGLTRIRNKNFTIFLDFKGIFGRINLGLLLAPT